MNVSLLLSAIAGNVLGYDRGAIQAHIVSGATSSTPGADPVLTRSSTPSKSSAPSRRPSTQSDSSMPRSCASLPAPEASAASKPEPSSNRRCTIDPAGTSQAPPLSAASGSLEPPLAASKPRRPHAALITRTAARIAELVDVLPVRLTRNPACSVEHGASHRGVQLDAGGALMSVVCTRVPLATSVNSIRQSGYRGSQPQAAKCA